MKKLFIVLIILSIASVSFCQTNDRIAEEYYYRGVDKIFIKDYRGAIFDLTEAIRRDSDFLQAYENRGVAKYYLDDNEGAIEDYNRALEINPYDYNTRGQIKYFLGDYEGALSDFNEVIKTWGVGRDQKSKALFWRAMVKIDNGDKDGGCEDLNRSVKLGYQEAGSVREVYCE